MLTIYNANHARHHGKLEMFRGELVPCFEIPARADYVLQELQSRKLGAIDAPTTGRSGSTSAARPADRSA